MNLVGRCRLIVSKPVFKAPMDSRERNAFACIERHQAFALAPMDSNISA
jgi:hypothetical protein